MDYQIVKENFQEITADAVIIPIAPDGQLPSITNTLDLFLDNFISDLIKTLTFSGKYGETCLILNTNNKLQAKLLLFIGIGDIKNITHFSYYELNLQAFNALKDYSITTTASLLAKVNTTLKNIGLKWKIHQIFSAFNDANYDLNIKDYQTKEFLKAQELQEEKFSNKNLIIIVTKTDLDTIAAEDIINFTKIENASVNLCKNLANLPSNICTPSYIANLCEQIPKQIKNLKCTVYGESQLQSMNCGAFLAVSKGGSTEGQLVIMEYQGADKSDKPYILVGKGITFDTGGYSLKPPKAMVGMKYDMCGAASVLATITAIAKLELKINVISLLACAENSITSIATKPDDIVTSYSGKTIEITNTDAEGRLVLCDTLSFSKQYDPKLIIDVATLTGASVVALGPHYSALMSNNQELAEALKKSALDANDSVCQLPLAMEYLPDLKSSFADLKNCTSHPYAGAITAAVFLSQFIPENVNWAHFDIAGSSTSFGKFEQSTGRPVRLLLNYLKNQNQQENN